MYAPKWSLNPHVTSLSHTAHSLVFILHHLGLCRLMLWATTTSWQVYFIQSYWSREGQLNYIQYMRSWEWEWGGFKRGKYTVWWPRPLKLLQKFSEIMALYSSACFSAPHTHLIQMNGPLSGLMKSCTFKPGVLEQGHILNIQPREYQAQCPISYKMFTLHVPGLKLNNHRYRRVVISLSYL